MILNKLTIVGRCMKRSLLAIFLLYYLQVEAQITDANIRFKASTAYEKNSKKTYTGVYTEYFPGDVKLRGQYVNGLREGIFEYYDAETNYNHHRILDSSVTFHMGKRNGIKLTYHINSFFPVLLQSSECYTNDKLDGMSIYWHRSGQLMYTRSYTAGKLAKQTDYPIDSSIILLDYCIREFPADTIYADKFHPGDTMTIELIGLKPVYQDSRELRPESLANKHFRVKSFKVVRLDSEISFYSDKFNLRYLTGIYNEDRLHIQNMIIVDPYGFEYKLLDKVILIVKNGKDN